MPAVWPVITLSAAIAWLFDTVQVPPDIVSERVIGEPMQTKDGPEMVPASGTGGMVMTFVATAVLQALLIVYRIVSIPACKPETSPLITVALPFVAPQDPVNVVSVKVNIAPTHTVDEPLIGPTYRGGATVTTLFETAVPQLFVIE